MSDFSSNDEPPDIRTNAEITLKKLLDKQLSTSGRLEQVEFEKATHRMQPVGHDLSGITSLSQFLENESVQKQLYEKAKCLQDALRSKGYSKDEIEEQCRKVSCFDSSTTTSDTGIKRRRYGADPLFITSARSEELEIAALENQYLLESKEPATDATSFGRHSKELEESLLRGKDRLQAIAHLAAGEPACRKPLFGHISDNDCFTGMTPEDRARAVYGKNDARLADNVFSKRAPDVLELHSFLKERPKEESIVTSIRAKAKQEICVSYPKIHDMDSIDEVSEKDIIQNRMSIDMIQKIQSGKFANYTPGNPSPVLYVKNLSSDATEKDLVALFARYQTTEQKLVFRLMKQGRMKGQAFITFPDEETSSKALQHLNGYILKGKPMVIQFGRSVANTKL